MAIINAILTILGLLRETISLLKELYEFLKNLKKNPSAKIFYQKEDLVASLRLKYPKTKFHITGNKDTFNRLISRELMEIIDEKIASIQGGSDISSDKVTVGIVCGPMTLHLAEWINRNKRIEKNKYSRVTFVAMNKAGEMDSYYYSANYLVTLFAKIFPGSGLIAYTANRYDQDSLKNYRNNIDILLCSVGSSQSGEKDYIEDYWIKHFSKEVIGKAELEKYCIGDFCLTPIDADGKIAVNPEMEVLLRSELDPYPLLRYIKEFKRADKIPYVIFPVNTSPTKAVRSNDSTNGIFPVTGKELTTRAVLRSGVANVCILDGKLARNLVSAVGGFLIHHLSTRPVDNNPFRKAKAYDLINKKDRDIAIIDPYYRLDALNCVLDQNLRAPANPIDLIPSIILAELTDEDEKYDWKDGEGTFEFTRYGLPYKFFVDKGVRKPGMWSIMTSLQGVRYLYLGRVDAKEDISIWDMGCGCGVIGILMERLSNGKVGKILFSDIDKNATTCADRNVISLGLQHKAQTRTGSLFSVAEPNEKFHIISFNPPFAPMAGITNVGLTIDSGGDSGQDLAIQFCSNVYDYLHIGGWAIIVVPDYIDDGCLQKILEGRFGHENVTVHNRFILYPYETKQYVPPAFEIEHKDEIERNCSYSFENCYLGGKQFLSFRMRHYLAKRVS